MSTPTSVTGQRLPAQRTDASAQGAVETGTDSYRLAQTQKKRLR